MSQKIQNAIIVGASRGLGLGLVGELVSRGASVTATVRNIDAADDLRALGNSVRILALDIDDHVAAGKFAASLGSELFDLVFMNAGIYGPQHQSAESATLSEIGQLFQTNAVSPIRVARLLAPHVKAHSGTLAFMTSYMGSVADNTTGGAELYRASKAALNSMTRGLANELKDSGITVLSMHPGWVRTAMGGPNAPVDVATSVRGLLDQIQGRDGPGEHAFIDYQGKRLAW